MLCKPVRIKHVGWTITSLCGAAVHEDDKQLVRVLIDRGDGIEFNEAFEEAVIAAAAAGVNLLQFNKELLVGMYGGLPVLSCGPVTVRTLGYTSFHNSITTRRGCTSPE